MVHIGKSDLWKRRKDYLKFLLYGNLSGWKSIFWKQDDMQTSPDTYYLDEVGIFKINLFNYFL